MTPQPAGTSRDHLCLDRRSDLHRKLQRLKACLPGQEDVASTPPPARPDHRLPVLRAPRSAPELCTIAAVYRQADANALHVHNARRIGLSKHQPNERLQRTETYC